MKQLKRGRNVTKKLDFQSAEENNVANAKILLTSAKISKILGFYSVFPGFNCDNSTLSITKKVF